jgi:hypothetical protein
MAVVALSMAVWARKWAMGNAVEKSKTKSKGIYRAGEVGHVAAPGIPGCQLQLFGQDIKKISFCSCLPRSPGNAACLSHSLRSSCFSQKRNTSEEKEKKKQYDREYRQRRKTQRVEAPAKKQSTTTTNSSSSSSSSSSERKRQCPARYLLGGD